MKHFFLYSYHVTYNGIMYIVRVPNTVYLFTHMLQMVENQTTAKSELTGLIFYSCGKKSQQDIEASIYTMLPREKAGDDDDDEEEEVETDWDANVSSFVRPKNYRKCYL